MYWYKDIKLELTIKKQYLDKLLYSYTTNTVKLATKESVINSISYFMTHVMNKLYAYII